MIENHNTFMIKVLGMYPEIIVLSVYIMSAWVWYVDLKPPEVSLITDISLVLVGIST